MKRIVWTPEMVANLRRRAEAGETAAQVAVAYGLTANEEKRIYAAAMRFGIRFRNVGRPAAQRAIRIVIDGNQRAVFDRAARRRRISVAELVKRLMSCIATDGDTLINNLLDDTP